MVAEYGHDHVFMLMGGQPYYPYGGFDDFQDFFPTLEEAKAEAEKHLNAEEWSDDWWSWANIAELVDKTLYIWFRDWGDKEWKTKDLT